MSQYVRAVDDKAEELNLDNYGVSPKGAKALALSLIINTSIVKLNLANNRLGAQGATYISYMMLENPFITELILVAGLKIHFEHIL